jgi:5-carboxymethyl-2-hydroxymuconate isomerase
MCKMPHITIEYSANLDDVVDADAAVETIHLAALDHGLPPIDGLRTRAVSRRHYRVADGDPAYAFVAVTARIGPGRDSGEKRSFVECLIDAAERAFGTTGPHAIAFSAEVQEIDPEFRINRNHIRTALGERSSTANTTSEDRG